VILCSAVLIQYRRVTDRHTQTHNDSVHRASITSRGNKSKTCRLSADHSNPRRRETADCYESSNRLPRVNVVSKWSTDGNSHNSNRYGSVDLYNLLGTSDSSMPHGESSCQVHKVMWYCINIADHRTCHPSRRRMETPAVCASSE